MNLAKEYFRAVWQIASFIGVFFLIKSATCDNFFAIYLCFCALSAGLAGPIGLLIEKRKTNEKASTSAASGF